MLQNPQFLRFSGRVAQFLLQIYPIGAIVSRRVSPGPRIVAGELLRNSLSSRGATRPQAVRRFPVAFGAFDC
jgi:hypothetical protein